MVETPEDSVYSRAGLGGRLLGGASPALVVVDMQIGFTDESRPLGASMIPTIGTIKTLLDAFHRGHRPVFFSTIAFTDAEIRARAYPWLDKVAGLTDLRQGTKSVELDPRLRTTPDDFGILKKGASAFFGTPLASLLTRFGIDTLVLTGATTSGCVRASAVDAVQHGLRCVVVNDAVADRMTAPHHAALFDLAAKYADVLSSCEVLTYLESAPSGPLKAEST